MGLSSYLDLCPFQGLIGIDIEGLGFGVHGILYLPVTRP